jgi:arylsulfatase A-like enzyme
MSVKTPFIPLKLLFLLAFWLFGAFSIQAKQAPNIVVMLADDMGFGELSCLNPNGKIKTPGLDAIAKNGLILTDGHSGSSVCTPTRYGLITGRYAWRTKLQSGVVTGGESLIAANRLTLPKMLREKNYHTAIIGKWHLNMLFDGIKNSAKSLPIGTKVTHGPIDRGGFDEYHGFHHARQMTLWIDNDKITKNLTPEEMLPNLTESAEDFIAAQKGKDRPFFLYLPWNSPHSPVVPTKEWQGKSGINAHADFVMQTDDSFDRVMKALKKHGFADNTLVICSADNGTSPSTSGLNVLKEHDHDPSAGFKGMKSDIWEGGHRVPFIISWPGVVEAGRTSNKLVCLTDLMATFAEMVNYTLPEDQGVDSFSFLPMLRGESDHARQDVIHHSISGQFSIRNNEWKLIHGPGSGGWGSPKTAEALKSAKEKGVTPFQLYNMIEDKYETKNVHTQHSEVADSLLKLSQKQIANGRSTPGKHLKNDVEVNLEKWNKPPAASKAKNNKTKKKKA